MVFGWMEMSEIWFLEGLRLQPLPFFKIRA